MICADFLAGANLENGNSNAFMHSLERMIELLPCPQKADFLERVRARRIGSEENQAGRCFLSEPVASRT
jgi:hypothetical protein